MATSKEMRVRVDGSSKIIPSEAPARSLGQAPSLSARFRRSISSIIFRSSSLEKSCVQMKFFAIGGTAPKLWFPYLRKGAVDGAINENTDISVGLPSP